jgi:3-hydroxyacyl-CoA dehydrogenase
LSRCLFFDEITTIFGLIPTDMKNITVIGSGTMGSGIAHCFAQYGFTVSLVDLTQDTLDTAQIKI